MPATSEVPTWQIFPTAGGCFRWCLAGGELGRQPHESSKTLGSRFPSMADLVRQAPPKLLEHDGGNRTGGVPMFRTGSGRTVSVTESSIQKAMSVLEGGDATDREAAAAAEGSEGKDISVPMFRTGSGKSVTLRQSSLRKAAAVLEEDVDNGAETNMKDGGSSDSFSMFRTGAGKSVMVSQSSVRRAAAVLEGDISEKEFLKPPCRGSNNYDVPMFQTGSGKSVLVKQSSINRALSVLQDDEENMETDKTCKLVDYLHHTFSNSLFQTGSGKAVNISSAGLSRASNLLGLEDTENLYASRSFQHNLSETNISINEREAPRSINPSSGAAYNNDLHGDQSDKTSSLSFSSDFYSSGNQPYKVGVQDLLGSNLCSPNVGHPPLKFHTAGGKSLSISSDALQRARSLLGESDVGSVQNVVKAHQSTLLVKDEKKFNDASWNKENISYTLHQNADTKIHPPKSLPPIPTFTNRLKSSSPLSSAISRGVHLGHVEVNDFLSEGDHHAGKNMSQELSKKVSYMAHPAGDKSGKLINSRRSAGPLVEVSNNICMDYPNMSGLTSKKKRPQRRSSISPFKRPRISRFTTPVNSNISYLTTDSTKLSASEKCRPRTRVSTRYPFKTQRKSIQDFFGGPPTKYDQLRHLPDRVQHMNPDNAETYRFCDTSRSDGIGSEDFRNILVQCGASLLSATKEWVANHYKWIVWKLACLERCYPDKASGKFLTTHSVIEELKYRYEREVNYGHRSAIKRILDGDASPASMMVLCISSICSHSVLDINKLNDTAGAVEDNQNANGVDGTQRKHATKIVLTDGWYSLDAILDVWLSKQLAAGKLFIGQKLRIWGAGLCGWVGPISPLEASRTVSLLIHTNGTYRAHWSDSLGICKHLGAPLAFRCINGAGGKVPRTLVGITRVYPVLYKERLRDGHSIVRSERTEKKVLQRYNERRCRIVEDIMAEEHYVSVNVSNSEEGARIFRILETSAEPELLMADMSSEQLMSFSIYQSKQEAIRHSSMQKKIEKALEDASLSSRDVTPFMRVRVVGLTKKGSIRRNPPREGLITIWNPTEKQKHLVEGQIYTVSGLMPLNFGSDILYLQARGSSTIWKHVLSISENIEPFFTPRKPVLLSNLGEVPLTSEFDIAAVVVHVGEVYISGCQKKQWIFLTAGSEISSEPPLEEPYDCLLAISFRSPLNDDDSSGLFSQSLVGTTVAFCNLVKRARDQMNHLWVAEATENSTYSVFYNLPKDSHLKRATESAKQWANISSSTIQKLRERVLCIVGGHGS